jgi:hypothetical protein
MPRRFEPLPLAHPRSLPLALALRRSLALALALVFVACSARYPVGASRASLAGPTIATHFDTIPNFAHGAGIVSVDDGAWSDSSTWSTGAPPGEEDTVLITHEVTYDASDGRVATVGVDEGGALRFRTDSDTRLSAVNIIVLPGGTLEVGTSAEPVEADVRAEIVIRDVPLDGASDPDQFGTALLGFGTITMHGAAKAPTFVRLSRAPSSGDTTLDVAESVTGWAIGDHLVIPDSRQVATESGGGRITYEHLEVVTVAGLGEGGRTVTFSPALAHDHPGTTDEDADGTPDYLPHAANLTRNIVVRSEHRTGTRGHVLFSDRAAIDVRYVAFEGLGRTTFDDLDADTNHIVI